MAIDFVDGMDCVVGRNDYFYRKVIAYGGLDCVVGSDLEMLKSSDRFYRRVIAIEFVGGLDCVVGSDLEILKSSDRFYRQVIAIGMTSDKILKDRLRIDMNSTRELNCFGDLDSFGSPAGPLGSTKTPLR